MHQVLQAQPVQRVPQVLQVLLALAVHQDPVDLQAQQVQVVPLVQPVLLDLAVHRVQVAQQALPAQQAQLVLLVLLEQVQLAPQALLGRLVLLDLVAPQVQAQLVLRVSADQVDLAARLDRQVLLDHLALRVQLAQLGLVLLALPGRVVYLVLRGLPGQLAREQPVLLDHLALQAPQVLRVLLEIQALQVQQVQQVQLAQVGRLVPRVPLGLVDHQARQAPLVLVVYRDPLVLAGPVDRLDPLV